MNRTVYQRKWTILAALAAVFALPLLLAWLLYHYQPFEHTGGLEHGELITPVQRLQVSDLHDLDGAPVDPGLFRGKWTLLYHVPAPIAGGTGSANRDGYCGDDCLALMDTLRRVRLAQGKSMRHVQRVLVEPAGAIDSSDRFDKGLQVVTADNWPLPVGSVYVVDPQGYLVLRYRPGFDPKGLLKDLQHLLRLAGEE